MHPTALGTAARYENTYSLVATRTFFDGQRQARLARFGGYPDMFRRLLGQGFDYAVYAADQGELPETVDACAAPSGKTAHIAESAS